LGVFKTNVSLQNPLYSVGAGDICHPLK